MVLQTDIASLYKFRQEKNIFIFRISSCALCGDKRRHHAKSSSVLSVFFYLLISQSFSWALEFAVNYLLWQLASKPWPHLVQVNSFSWNNDGLKYTFSDPISSIYVTYSFLAKEKIKYLRKEIYTAISCWCYFFCILIQSVCFCFSLWILLLFPKACREDCRNAPLNNDSIVLA